MSIEDLYAYIQGEFQTVERMLQYPAGTGLVYIRDKNRVRMAGYSIEIWDAVTDGVQLIEDTDYVLGHIDADLSTLETQTIYGGYQVLNVAYQGVNLYVTASIVGGYTTRPYRPTYITINTDYTTAPSSVDDSIFADAESNPIAVTLADGTYVNQRFAIACTGLNDVTVSGTGLEATAYNNIAVQFIWNGTGWLQLGGAGGGAASAGNLSIGTAAWFAGTGTIPFDKLECNGDVYNIEDYPGLFGKIGNTYPGGDGVTTFAVPDMQGITPGHVGTQDVNGNTKGDSTPIGGVREDQMQQITGSLLVKNGTGPRGFATDSDVTGAFGVTGATNVLDFGSGATSTFSSDITFDSASSPDSRTGEYTRSTELVGRWLIQAFDTVQEIPADPGLVKDYNLVWEETPASTVVNAWGAGLFFLAYNYDYAGSTVYGNAFMGVAIDGFDREIVIDVEQAGGDSEVRGRYDFSTNSFTIETGGAGYTNPQIHAIYKWGDVATGELDPPIDGWEELYNDYTTTLSTYPNIAGDGYYKIVARDVTNTESCPFVIQVNKADSTTASIVTPAVAGATLRITYSYSTDTFSIANDAGTYYFAEVWKFNSLVNVVHSYNGPLQEIDTTAGDVDVSADLADLATGAIRIYSNIGTGGNHITGLPNSITLGDGKTFTIHRGEVGWRYEDVVIDERSEPDAVVSGIVHNYIKYSGGEMTYVLFKDSAIGPEATYNLITPFTSIIGYSHGSIGGYGYSGTIENTQASIMSVNSGGTAINADATLTIKGRWKAGA